MIKRYRLNTSLSRNELRDILKNLGFEENIQGKEYYTNTYILTHDISLTIRFNITDLDYTDFNNNDVNDENGYFYAPFYNGRVVSDEDKRKLEHVIIFYNKRMDMLVENKVLLHEEKVIEFNKIVHNKIPEIIKNEGYTIIGRKIEDREEAKKLLLDKLTEETDEFKKTPNLEEYCDILEVLEMIRKQFLYQWSDEEIEETKENLRKKKGSFSDLYYLERVTT